MLSNDSRINNQCIFIIVFVKVINQFAKEMSNFEYAMTRFYKLCMFTFTYT